MNVTFIFPMAQGPWWAVFAAAALSALAWALLRLNRRRAARLHALVETPLALRLSPGYDARARRPLFWLPLAGTACVLLALAQPHWGRAWVETSRGSRDILVLLDTSESMNAENPPPNRLARARQKIEALLEFFPGDRFGLLVFSGEAALECPLTQDLSYFRSVLANVDTNSLNEEGTDIAEALRQATEAIRGDDAGAAGKENANRALILLSDGEDISGEAVEAAKAAGATAPVYVLGIGDPKGAEVKLPAWMQEFSHSSKTREPHLSRLDEKTLSEIAVAGGGMYVRSTPGNDDVRHMRNELEGVSADRVSGAMRFNLVNRYRWPLSLAWGFFAAEGLWIALMPWLRRGRAARETAGEGA